MRATATCISIFADGLSGASATSSGSNIRRPGGVFSSSLIPPTLPHPRLPFRHCSRLRLCLYHHVAGPPPQRNLRLVGREAALARGLIGVLDLHEQHRPLRRLHQQVAHSSAHVAQVFHHATQLAQHRANEPVVVVNASTAPHHVHRNHRSAS